MFTFKQLNCQQITYLGLFIIADTHNLEAAAFSAVYFSLSVSS